ncbi:MAG: phage Gp19/Gp15/Gp42 family protein [Eubacteriales bacterium]|uniref:phage Gp19/Gp15/Gp42 family protein n=1 Tax=Anaerococcus sp. TaxID=1872515 RepID=UPI002A9205DD|nr:phage Gp19/Gp15/Gp42 family protein [Anaerococcus sp.]MDD6920464.1 phage Gp19/Gp15/Gp42 family protein [Eubacteriales bacterium]MDY6127730.1 phage Gp19/Gp15/Gp42 family protein [Anaerococcus sp.]
MEYCSVDDVISLWRSLKNDEILRVKELIPVIISSLKVEADKVGKDLDQMAKENEAYRNVLKSVIVDVVARTLMTATDQEPMTQYSESALGYSFSGSFLVPGGGLFIKKSELSRLGLKRQRYGVIDFYDTNKGNPCDFDFEE